MRIIEQGKKRESTYEAKCGSCGCRFEVGPHDCQFHADSRDGNYYSCNCPQCGVNKTIAASLFTNRIIG